MISGRRIRHNDGHRRPWGNSKIQSAWNVAAGRQPKRAILNNAKFTFIRSVIG